MQWTSRNVLFVSGNGQLRAFHGTDQVLCTSAVEGSPFSLGRNSQTNWACRASLKMVSTHTTNHILIVR